MIKFAQHSLGSIVPSGRVIKKISAEVNVMRDNTSKRRHSHSMAAAVLNFGREYPSISLKLMSRNLGSWSKLLIVIDPDSVSEKCCITGALLTPHSRASSRAAAM